MSTNQKLLLATFFLFLVTRKTAAKVLEGISIDNLWFVGTNNIPLGQEIILDIEVENRNPVGAKIIGIEGNLKVSGVEVAKVALLTDTIIPGAGKERVPLLFTIDYLTLSGNILGLIETGNWLAEGICSGVLIFDNGLEIPFSQKVKA